VNADTDPPLDPFAERLATRLDRSAEEAGQDAGDDAQGKDTDDASERDELDRLATAVIAQLREESTWSRPPPELRASVLARALAADAPIDNPTTPRPEPPALAAVPDPEPGVDARVPIADVAHEPNTTAPATGLPPRWRRLRYAVPLAAAAAVLFTFAVVAIDRTIRGDTPAGQHYTATGSLPGGQRPRIDLIVADTGAAGFAVVVQPHDLPGAAEGWYYAAWLRKPGSPDAYVPLGSFHARRVAAIRLWSGVSPREYPEFVVTVQRVGQPATPSDRVVATAMLD
jgi:hypothetical protein